jgi:hypothetical protein
MNLISLEVTTNDTRMSHHFLLPIYLFNTVATTIGDNIPSCTVRIPVCFLQEARKIHQLPGTIKDTTVEPPSQPLARADEFKS